MTDQLPEPEGLTDESIAPDTGGPLADPDEATDPDIRNTTRDQDAEEDD